MFMFNKYDCYGTQYICFYRNGTYYVDLCEGDDAKTVFQGHLEECIKFVEDRVEAAENSLY